MPNKKYIYIVSAAMAAIAILKTLWNYGNLMQLDTHADDLLGNVTLIDIIQMFNMKFKLHFLRLQSKTCTALIFNIRKNLLSKFSQFLI